MIILSTALPEDVYNLGKKGWAMIKSGLKNGLNK